MCVSVCVCTHYDDKRLLLATACVPVIWVFAPNRGESPKSVSIVRTHIHPAHILIYYIPYDENIYIYILYITQDKDVYEQSST